MEGLSGQDQTEPPGEETAEGGAPWDDLPAPQELAASFPQLEIIGLHGRGGMGAVYKARQPGLDRLVALKILPPSVSNRPAFEERFTREARALAKLGHPNIVAVHDFGRAGGLYYFIMEFVDGANLRQMLAGGQLSPHEALAIVPQICDALQYAHEEGVVHRDIKPENILIDRKGRVKIADFGLAKLLGGPRSDYTLTAAQQVMGTPHYMAPEQLQSAAQVDHRADIYSLGVVFYEMLTGELPLGRFPPPSQQAPVEARVDEIVMRTLEKEPQRRYQRVSEVKTDLQGVGAPEQPIPMALPYRPPLADPAMLREIRRPVLGLIITGLLAMLGPMWVGMIWKRWGPPPDSDPSWWILVYPNWSVVPIAGTMMFLGALKMWRLESLGWAKVGSVLGLMPWTPAWLIGLPSGIWALRVLRKPTINAVFAAAQIRQTALGPIVRRRRIGRFSLVAIVLVSAAAAGIALMQLRPSPRIFYTFGGLTPFVSGADGPMLSEPIIHNLGLSRMQTAAANRIFQSYYHEFVSIERRHTVWFRDDKGHVHITIQPFPEEADALTARMWQELGGVMDRSKVPQFGAGQSASFYLFRHGGKAAVTAELWKEGKTFHFEEKLHVLYPGGGWGDNRRGSSGPDAKQVFPEEYWIYWEGL
jgi:hypothetical protein